MVSVRVTKLIKALKDIYSYQLLSQNSSHGTSSPLRLIAGINTWTSNLTYNNTSCCMGKLHAVAKDQVWQTGDVVRLLANYLACDGKIFKKSQSAVRDFGNLKNQARIQLTTCQHTHCDSTLYYQKCPMNFAVFVNIIVTVVIQKLLHIRYIGIQLVYGWV